ncbi:hypothetical protein ACFU8Q_00560 [Streptomyces sp. NPDC057543]|uniref:hypothetical protein n=1 Tax=Streptomyces sp. NPDC057543 TaxID=3346163 RepID=UPI0036C051CA
MSRFGLGTLAQAHRDFLSRRRQDLHIDLIQVGLWKVEGHLVAGCVGDRVSR